VSPGPTGRRCDRLPWRCSVCRRGGSGAQDSLGPGYRVYFARIGQVVVLLLCGGDKRMQDEDIKNAKDHFEDFKRRTAEADSRKRT
jgi:putative addiction module killer protein